MCHHFPQTTIAYGHSSSVSFYLFLEYSEKYAYSRLFVRRRFLLMINKKPRTHSASQCNAFVYDRERGKQQL